MQMYVRIILHMNTYHIWHRTWFAPSISAAQPLARRVEGPKMYKWADI